MFDKGRTQIKDHKPFSWATIYASLVKTYFLTIEQINNLTLAELDVYFKDLRDKDATATDFAEMKSVVIALSKLTLEEKMELVEWKRKRRV